MPKRTTATSADFVSKDDTGAFVSLDYVCPYCDASTGELIFVGASGRSMIDSDFETDQVCGVCDKAVIIEVSASLY